jgi:putative nucleotidyltransferase with HDIG domain
MKVISILIDAHKINEPYDILIVDNQMPNLTGLEIVEMCKAEESLEKISCLMMTAGTNKLNIQKCFEAGANDFLEKPFSNIVMIRKIDALFRLGQVDNLEFRSIRPSTFIDEMPVTFDVYMSQHGRYRILLKNADIVTNVHKLLLQEYKIEELFIISQSEPAYINYLGSYINNLMEDKIIDKDDKADFLSNYGEKEISEVFNHPTEHSIRKLKLVTKAINNYLNPLKTDSINSICNLEKHDDIYAHSLRVGTIALMILKKILILRKDEKANEVILAPFKGSFLGSEEENSLIMEAALLHDIGKTHESYIDGPDKEASHAELGVEILREIPGIDPKLLEIVSAHEELCDGSGMPLGLAKNKTGLITKLISFANICDHQIKVNKLTLDELILFLHQHQQEYFLPYIKVFQSIK